MCDKPRKKPVSYKGCQQLCGGSIISHFHILTAAHCLLDSEHHWSRRKPHEVVVRVGVRNLKEPEVIPDNYRTTLEVRDLFIHKDYHDPFTTLDDIAIIKLKDKIKFSALIRPVCINGLHLNYRFKHKHPNVIVAGWGDTNDDNGTFSDVLKYARQYILSFTICEGNTKDQYTEFCVYHRHWKNGYTCSGDSGSGLLPLDKNQNPVNVLVGVLHGRLMWKNSSKCGAPKFYLNVTTYAKWINENAK